MARFYDKEERIAHSFDFGDLVQSRRLQLGWSFQELANRTGVSASYLNRLELKDKKNITVPIMIAICRALEIDMFEALRSFGYEAEGKKEGFEDVFVFPLEEKTDNEVKAKTTEAIKGILLPSVSPIEAMEMCLDAIKSAK